MVGLAVRYAQTSANTSPVPVSSPYGETLSFDFTPEVEQYGGTVLAYGVALTGFVLDYLTNSVYFAENVGHLAVRLVPNLVGNVVTVAANATITDYDADAPNPGKNQKNPATMIQ